MREIRQSGSMRGMVTTLVAPSLLSMIGFDVSGRATGGVIVRLPND